MLCFPDYDFYSDVLRHIVKTCGTVVTKTYGEPLFGIEFYAECWVFPGLTLAELASVPTGTGCRFGVGEGRHVQLYSFE